MRIDCTRAATELDAYGCALLPSLVTPTQCFALCGTWSGREAFRSEIVSARHGYGSGAYRYFDDPLPPLVQQPRTVLYPPLAAIASRWAEALSRPERYPPDHIFPLQVAILLSRLGEDFTGGEFVMAEQRPRMQSRAEIVPLIQSDAVIFPARGLHHRQLHHGVSRLRSGTRFTLGIIFHGAG